MGSAVASRRAKIRVAIVDDHRLVLEALESKLGERATGLSISIAECRWVDAIAHPDFPVDVVVLDLHLEDSIPIGTKIRALSSMGIPAVVISRHSDATSVAAALRAGASHFVSKSGSTSELIAAITSAVENNDATPSPMPPASSDVEPASPDPRLGKQELRALVLYAGSRSIREVAAEMSTTEETVKSYIKRGRSKYRRVGIDVGTRILLRHHALREGWIAPE